MADLLVVRAVDEPRDDLRMSERLREVDRRDPASSSMSCSGSRTGRTLGLEARFFQFQPAHDPGGETDRIRSSTAGSRRAETRACISAPPSDFVVRLSPVAIFTSGGPPRNTFERSPMKTDSRHACSLGAARGGVAEDDRGCSRAFESLAPEVPRRQARRSRPASAGPPDSVSGRETAGSSGARPPSRGRRRNEYGFCEPPSPPSPRSR